MIYPGKNLFISIGGQVVACAKSCDVSVDSDTIPVSSATDGDWAHSLPGRKKWSVSTGHLLRNISRGTDIQTTFHAFSKPWIDTTGNSYMSVNGVKQLMDNGDRGLMLFIYRYANGVWTPEFNRVYDTYQGQTGGMIQDMEFYLWYDVNKLAVIISRDAFTIDANLKAEIVRDMSIPADQISLISNTQAAFAAIGGPGIAGIAKCQIGRTGTVNVTLNTILGSGITETPLKDSIGRVGQMVNIRVSVDGFGADTVAGTAICKTFRATANIQNLLQGSFAWEGTGPLE